MPKRIDIDPELLAERYRTGESTIQLAESYGCTSPTIYRHLKLAGVTLRTASEAAVARDPRSRILKNPRTGTPYAERVARDCPACGSEVEVLVSRARTSAQSFCNRSCVSAWMKSQSLATNGAGWRALPIGSVRAQAKGYLFEKTESGWIQQHRLVMERHLGRKLRKYENVHHINGVKSDNNLKNLELWVVMQPTGQRPCELVAFALEVLGLYEEECHQARDPKEL